MILSTSTILGAMYLDSPDTMQNRFNQIGNSAEQTTQEIEQSTDQAIQIIARNFETNPVPCIMSIIGFVLTVVGWRVIRYIRQVQPLIRQVLESNTTVKLDTSTDNVFTVVYSVDKQGNTRKVSDSNWLESLQDKGDTYTEDKKPTPAERANAAMVIRELLSSSEILRRQLNSFKDAIKEQQIQVSYTENQLQLNKEAVHMLEGQLNSESESLKRLTDKETAILKQLEDIETEINKQQKICENV